MMKKLMILLLALLLGTAAFAETAPNLPVALLPHEQAAIPLETVLTKAQAALDKMPTQFLIRAELAQMTDGSKVWFVTIFDTATFVDAWCVRLDDATGAVLKLEAGEAGYFAQEHAAWTAQKGPSPMWQMEDKALNDALYALLPVYGLPMENDMTQEAAIQKALTALGLTNTEGCDVGYGYIMGGEGYNGMWEITLVRDGQTVYQVNLDAVTGEVFYMIPDEAGNG